MQSAMFYFTPYIIQPLLSAAICGALAVYALRRRHARAALPVFWTMLVLSGWSLAYALNTAALSLSTKILFYKIATTLGPFVGVSLLALALEAAGFGGWLTRRRLIGLLSCSAFAVLLAWTSEMHTLFRHDFSLLQSGPLLVLDFKIGPAWHLYMLYVTVLNIAALLILLTGARRSPAGSRARFLLIVYGTVVPLLVEILSLSPVRGFSMTTSTFWFSGICYTLAIFRHHLLGVAPIARTALFDQLDEPILVFDAQGELADCNNAARRLFSPKSAAPLPRLSASAFERFPILSNARSSTIDNVVTDTFDEKSYWRIKSLPLEQRGNKVGNLVRLSDISVMKQGEELLLKAHYTAETASRAKSVFLANMSHEIRTPMNAIIGFTELVLDTPLDREQRRSLETVKQSAEALLALLNDIMDFSKIEANKMEIEEIDFDLHELVDASVETLSLQAEQKGLNMDYAIDPDVPALLRGDPVRLQQVLLNLVGNAIKFTESGSVNISVRIAPTANAETNGIGDQHRSETVSLLFSVQDTGIGIPGEKLNSIFSSFAQADSSITRKYGGTGLGLSISSQLVKIMGGELSVVSVERKGSTFSFSVPFKPGRHADALATATAAPQSFSLLPVKRVLLVEDIATNRALFVRLLRRKGHDVATATNGREALRILERESFDIILMDIQMPEMDGYEAARTIRDPHSSVLDHTAPIIALTAHSLAEDRTRCIAAGMNGYLSKPLKPHELLAAIEQYTTNAADTRPASSTEVTDTAGSPVPGQLPQGYRIEARATRMNKIREELLVRYSGDYALVEELLELFRGEIPGLLEKIADALDARNAGLLEMQAHACKSAAGAVGFDFILELSRQIEQSARSGDFDAARSSYQRLVDEVRTVLT